MANISYNDIAKSIYLSISEEKDFIPNVINFLNKRKLLSKSKIILDKVEKLILIENSSLSVVLESVSPLSEKEKIKIAEELKEIYKVKSIVFEDKIDMRLIGGFRVLIDNEIIDLSIKHQLKELQKHLTK